MATFTAITKSSDATFTNTSETAMFTQGEVTPGLIAPYVLSSGTNVLSFTSKSSAPTWTNINEN